jgi:drug/metabolite transporter (DMT)-like permease
MDLVLVAIVLFSGLLHASWNAVVKGGPDAAISAGIVMGTSALIALVAVCFFPLPSPVAWPWIIYSGVIHTVYLAVLAAAYKIGDLGRVYPIARGSAPALVAMASVPLLAEELSAQIYLGIALIIAAVLSLAVEPSGGARFHRRSLVFALLTGVSIAGYSMIDAVGIRIAIGAGDPVLMYIMWLFVVGCGPYAILALWARRRGLRHYRRRHWLISIAGGCVAMIGYGLVLWSFSKGTVAPIAALRESGVIFAALIGTFVFGEGKWRQRLVAACLFFAGAVVIQL